MLASILAFFRMPGHWTTDEQGSSLLRDCIPFVPEDAPECLERGAQHVVELAGRDTRRSELRGQ